MPSDFVLSQGMLASADIMVGKRPLISCFTYPIRAFEGLLMNLSNYFNFQVSNIGFMNLYFKI